MDLVAFGETKALTAWLEDPRCVVSYATLAARIRLTWDPERAISTPVSPRPKRSVVRDTVKLDRQHRLVIPAWARRHLGLQDGDTLVVQVTDEAILLIPTPWA